MEVRLKQFSEDVDESLVVFWHVEEGDVVQAGETLAEVQTEKAVTEIKAEEAGVISEILVQRGESAKVGEVLARLTTIANTGQQNSTEKDEDEHLETAAEQEQKPFVRISPRLRKLARHLSVELHDIRGTGKDNQVTEEDIQQAAGKQKQHQTAVPFSGIRRRIAKKMVDSLQTTAQLTITSWADVTELAAERKRLHSGLSWTALAAKAMVTALESHPHLNAHVHDGEVIEQRRVHLGIAIDTEAGVHVPVLRNADTLTVGEIDQRINLLAEKARDRKLSTEESSGSTITLSSLGMYSVQFFTPILNLPEAAILGVGKVESYLVLEEGIVTERKRLPLSLTFDHRAVDGAPAARFLEDVAALLGQPERVAPKPFQV